MAQIDLFEDNFIDLLYLTRREIMKKYQLNLEHQYMQHYQEIYIKKNLTHLKGAQAKDFFDRLEEP